MKITFIFILILFIDSVNRVYRVQVELAESNKQQGGYVASPTSHLAPTLTIPFQSLPIISHHQTKAKAKANKPAERPSSDTSAWKYKRANSIPNATCTSADSRSSCR